jgi:hypothetical protein
MLGWTTNSLVINTNSFPIDYYALQCTPNVQQLTDKTTYRKQQEHIKSCNQRKALRTKKVDEECSEEFAKICNNPKLRVKHWDQTLDDHRKQLHHVISTAANKSIPKRSHAQKCRPISNTIYDDLIITLRSAKTKTIRRRCP